MKTNEKLAHILREIEHIDNTKLTVTMEDGKTFDAVIFLGNFTNITKSFYINVNQENNLSDEENTYVFRRFYDKEIGLRPAKKIQTILNQFKREHNKSWDWKDDSWKIKSVEVA